ncbi:MAG: hypothetical protein H0U75_04420 [Legionella sp.]|nr:hypothetical protein [Legionella sp.]
MRDSIDTSISAFQEQPNQMVISWDGLSHDTLPVSDHRALVYDVILADNQLMRVLTWNIMQLGVPCLAFPSRVGAPFYKIDVKAIQKEIIAKKLKQCINLENAPKIIALQDVSHSNQKDLDTVSIILKALNQAQKGHWVSVRNRGLVTLYDSSILEYRPTKYKSPSVAPAEDESLLTPFVMKSDTTCCLNFVNINRASRDKSARAVNDFADFLLEVDNYAPESHTIVVGDADQHIPVTNHSETPFYNPTAARNPNFRFIQYHKENKLQVHVPHTVAVCMTRLRGRTNYEVARPSFLIGQTQNQFALQVISLSPQDMQIHSKDALKATIKAYSEELRLKFAGIEAQDLKKSWANDITALTFFSKLEEALQNENLLLDLIHSGQIVSTETVLSPMMRNTSLFVPKGQTLDEMDVTFALKKKRVKEERKQDAVTEEKKDDVVNVYAESDDLNNQFLILNSSAPLEGMEQYDIKEEGPLDYKYVISNSDKKAMSYFVPYYPGTLEKVEHARINLAKLFKKIKTKSGETHPSLEVLEQSIEEYVSIISTFIKKLPAAKIKEFAQFEKAILKQEGLILKQALPLLHQNESKFTDLYRAVRIFLKSLRVYLHNPLNAMVAGAAIGAATGALLGAGIGASAGTMTVPIIGTGVGAVGCAGVAAATGAIVGASGGFFAGLRKVPRLSDCKEEVTRQLLKNDLQEHTFLNRFFLNPHDFKPIESNYSGSELKLDI